MSDTIINLRAGTVRNNTIRFNSSGQRGVQGIQGEPGTDGASFDWEGTWTTATAYLVNEVVAQNGSSYIALVDHTSGTFATDLSGGKWQLMAQKGTDGAGAGDMTKAIYDPADKEAQIAVDTEVVHIDGDTMTGPLEIAAVSGAAAIGDLPLGRASALNTGLNLIGSFDGGEDNGTGTDSNARLNIYSYQRAQTGSFGETIRHFIMRSDAKAMNTWYLPKDGYDGSREPITTHGWSPVWWVGAHSEANDHGSWHNHGSIEVPDSTGALQTRLEIPFVDQFTWTPGTPYGVDTTNIRTNQADFSVRASGGVLRVGGPNANNKDILLSIGTDRNQGQERWKIRANTTTEAGSNTGTDFQINRYNDSGTLIATALHIVRSNGRIGINTTTPTTLFNVLSISGGAAEFQSTDASSATGIVRIIGADTGRRGLQVLVTGDANARYSVFANGLTEWGDGTASRDTNLYRSAANTLATDDTFVAGAGLTVSTLTGILVATSGVVGTATAGVDYQSVVKRGLAKSSGGTLQYGVPGSGLIGSSTSTLTVNEVRYVPFEVKYPITITAQQLEVTSAPASDANVRVGIYSSDGFLQPTGSPLYDTGIAVATGFTGLKATTGLSLALTPGMYLVALNCDVALTLRTVTSTANSLQSAIGATPVTSRYGASQTYGSFPSTGTKWTTPVGNTGGLQNQVFFQWTE